MSDRCPTNNRNATARVHSFSRKLASQRKTLADIRGLAEISRRSSGDRRKYVERVRDESQWRTDRTSGRGAVENDLAADRTFPPACSSRSGSRLRLRPRAITHVALRGLDICWARKSNEGRIDVCGFLVWPVSPLGATKSRNCRAPCRLRIGRTIESEIGATLLRSTGGIIVKDISEIGN